MGSRRTDVRPIRPAAADHRAVNYYRAVEKKAEHGGGWAFMQLNRRAGAAIVCGCTWETPGHVTAEEAERCFYDAQVAKGVRWHTYTSAHKCAICEEWTPDGLGGAGNLIDPVEFVCRSHFADDVEASDWLWAKRPFQPGIQITASW